MENLMGYDDIICEFAVCNFNLLDRVVIFYLISFNLELQICYNRHMRLGHDTWECDVNIRFRLRAATSVDFS